MPSPATLGFAGLGRMGGRVAARLAERFELIVFNRTRATAEAFAARSGARVAERPADLTVADAVVVMVAGDEAVRAVLDGADGLLGGLRDGQSFISLATISPDVAVEVADAVRRAGGRPVVAPVAGAPPQADGGQLTVIAGGDEADVEEALPVLEAIGSRIIRLPGAREAAALKLAFNLIIHDLNVALAEGMALAERAGLPRGTAYELLADGPLGCPFVLNKRRFFEDPNLDQPGGATVRLAEDDLGMALSLADRLGLRVEVTAAAREQLRRAAEAGLAERDESAVSLALG